MRDANASVSNYFHILWRKFSLEGPKTNFQPKRNKNAAASTKEHNNSNNKTSGNWGNKS